MKRPQWHSPSKKKAATARRHTSAGDEMQQREAKARIGARLPPAAAAAAQRPAQKKQACVGENNTLKLNKATKSNTLLTITKLNEDDVSDEQIMQRKLAARPCAANK